MDAYKGTNFNGGHWQLSSLVCERNMLTARWKKASDSAWISHLRAMQPNAVFDDDAMSAMTQITAMATVQADTAEEIPTVRGINLDYQEIASRYGIQIKVEPPKETKTAPLLPGEQVVPSNVAKSKWVALPVSVVSSIDPATTAMLLKRPGLRLNKLVFLDTNGIKQYAITGTQYANSQ
jgi:hypothetical protein